jgi:hypothetical protein
MEPATLASVIAMLFFSEALKEGEKAAKSTSDLAATLAQGDRKRERMASGMWACPIPSSRMPVLGPRHPKPTPSPQQVWRETAV